MMVYADLARPATKRPALLYDLLMVFGGAVFVALSAQAAVYLPFSPVPVTGQTLAVLLVGVLLGRQRGTAAVLVYLAEGAMGLPVFAGGMGGTAVLLGPTGGYLFGFVAAAYVTGMLAERAWDRHVPQVLVAMVLGNLVIYGIGLVWLSTFVGWDRVLALGFWPFVPGDIAKVVLAALLLPVGWRLITKTGFYDLE
ncbi:MAG: biotin transporter BioY [Anaerolineae bacterium]|nr:biotin transporter BioY [Anaerolineae bacterium]